MLKYFFDEILLFKAGKTARFLLKKDLENKNNQTGNIRSFDIPNIFANKNSVKDIKKLEKEFRDREKSKLNNKSNKWNSMSVYISIIKTFKRFYGFYFLLSITNIIISYYVKIKSREFFNSFVSNNESNKKLIDAFRGIFLLFLQVLNIVFTTHCEYYGTWLHYKVQSAISGSSLLRFLECKRIKNNDGLCILDSSDSTELLSLYQSIILVDADFTEYAVSNLINIIIHPLHVLTSVMVAYSIFEGYSLKICLLVLFICFFLTIITQYLSSTYKRPFLKAREERIAETTRLLEHSRYLTVTHQLLPSINKLINGKRFKELYYNSFRKYICMISEIFDRYMILSCTLSIGLYILYNKTPPSQASLMIIQSAWIIPTFYHPLNEVVFFVYYLIEGTISMDRIANFLNSTRSDINTFNDNSNEQNYLSNIESNCNQLLNENKFIQSLDCNIRKIKLKNISFTCGENVNSSVKDLNFDLIPGIPCFVLGKICSGKTALLQGISGYLFKKNNKNYNLNGSDGYFSLEFDNNKLVNVSDVSNYMCIGYVPQFPWIASGLTLADIILCGNDYIEELWNKVLYQCDLEVDFHNWGVNSINEARRRIVTDKQFSAGQKVRLSLARAIYLNLSNKDKRPKLLLVDCVLNSLDPFVCELILNRLFSRNGLLCNCMSIFVIEPPILELTRKASLNNGFSFKIINMSNKMMTCTEDVVVNRNFNESNVLEDRINNNCLNNENLCEITNDKNITRSKIDLIKNKFNHYYPVNFFYLFFAGSKRKGTDIIDLQNNNIDLIEKNDMKRSNNETIILLLLLIVPPILCKLSESFLLMILKDEDNLNLILNGLNSELYINNKSILFLKNINIYKSLLYKIPIYIRINILSFWYLIYNSTYVISMITICIINLLEIRIGLRAAKYFHNSLLLGYLGATSNSMLRWFPTSFILNRLSNDQLYIDYCITRRTRFVIIALNSILISIIPSIFASSQKIITLIVIIFIGLYLYYNYIRYFINGCRTLRSCYVSEYSPLVETIQTIGKGKKCLTTKKIRKFFFETSIKHINSALKPQFVQICLDAWFKMRIKLLVTIPMTLVNIILPFICNDENSSTKSIIALAIATTTGLIPLLSSLVSYWTKLETELVSVERSRLYLAVSREAGLEYIKMQNYENQKNLSNKNDLFIELKDVEAKYSRLDYVDGTCNFDNSYLIGSNVVHTTCLNGINTYIRAGEIVGIIGRTGSGKTTLLDIFAKILLNTNGKIVLPKPEIEDNIYEKLIKLNFPIKDFDSIILRTTMEFQKNLSHIASLPLEIYYPRDGNIRDIVDPFEQYSYEEIRAALNICGFGFYINKIEKDILSKENEISYCDQLESNPLTLNYNHSNKATSIFLNEKLEDLKLSILQLRMLLFVNFFLRRDKIKILLVDEPPVISKKNSPDCNEDPQINSKKEYGCILSSVINQYFKHCIVFIVSHDIRSLQYVNRILILRNGSLIKDMHYNQVFTSSELFNLVKINSDN